MRFIAYYSHEQGREHENETGGEARLGVGWAEGVKEGQGQGAVVPSEGQRSRASSGTACHPKGEDSRSV